MAKAKAVEGPKSPEQILLELEKKFGLESKKSKGDTKSVSSGSYRLDRATEIGGHPIGKVIEMFGLESSGKSTIALHAIKEFQIAFPGRKVALYDFEHSFSEKYAENIGVDVDALLIYQPDYMEQGYDLLLGQIENGLISLAVIDSHTAAMPKAIVEGEMSAATIGLQARINSKFLGKVKGLLEKNECTLMGVSQTRVNIGGMGDTNISTGGSAWKFYSDVRYKLWKRVDKDNELNESHIEVIKNKCAKPFGEAVLDIVWGVGFDNHGEIIDMGVECGLIKKSGSWYSYDEKKIGQGREAVKDLFIDNDEFFQQVKERVLYRIDNPTTETKNEEKNETVGV